MPLAVFEPPGLVGEAACGALPWLVEQNEFKEVLYRLAMLEAVYFWPVKVPFKSF